MKKSIGYSLELQYLMNCDFSSQYKDLLLYLPEFTNKEDLQQFLIDLSIDLEVFQYIDFNEPIKISLLKQYQHQKKVVDFNHYLTANLSKTNSIKKSKNKI